jgi:hypothetical protein
VKVEVTGLIGLKAGAKTYKLAELELISRANDTGAVMVEEKDVVLGTVNVYIYIYGACYLF